MHPTQLLRRQTTGAPSPFVVSPAQAPPSAHAPAGKKDSLCQYPTAVAAVAKAAKGTLVTFDVGHFDPYVEPTLGKSLAKQLEFLKQHAV